MKAYDTSNVLSHHSGGQKSGCCRTVFVLKALRAPEKAMARHSSTLAWKIPWTEEPGRLQSMGSLRVGHD